MVDQTHAKSISAQSAPVVFAALITTCGVIVSAFIQSGYFGRPTPPAVALASPTIPIAKASFLGTVEPLAESALPGRPSAGGCRELQAGYDLDEYRTGDGAVAGGEFSRTVTRCRDSFFQWPEDVRVAVGGTH